MNAGDSLFRVQNTFHDVAQPMRNSQAIRRQNFNSPIQLYIDKVCSDLRFGESR